MPSRAIPNGQTVTLRLDAELVLELKMAALRSRVGLSELIGSVLADALESGTLQQRHGILTHPTVKRPAAPMAPAAPKEPRPTKPKGSQGHGDAELFQRVEAAIKAGKIGQAQLMREVAPDINPANYRSSWAKSGHIPERFVPAVQAFLERLENSQA